MILSHAMLSRLSRICISKKYAMQTKKIFLRIHKMF